MNEIFEKWSLSRKYSKINPISTATIENYRFIWSSWMNYLSKLSIDWTAAQAADIRSFLQSIQPTSLTRKAASTVTQKRYARVLKEVYALAVVESSLAINPVTAHAFISFTESQDSFIFSPDAWSSITSLPSVLDEANPLLFWESVRNNAILHLLIFEAMQVTEIQEAQGQDCLVDSFGNINRLAVRGHRSAQNRVIVLQSNSAKALMQWQQVRALKLDGNALAQSALFLSRKGKTELSAKSVFCIAKEYLDEVLPADIENYRRSPGALRNTRIYEWLHHESPEKVSRKAGLQDVNSLSRLLSKI